MNGTRIARVMAMIGGAVMIGPLTACTVGGPGGGGRPGTMSVAAPSASTVDRDPAADQAVLTAIEEFLDRTEDYQLTGAVATARPAPPAPAVRAASVSPEPREPNRSDPFAGAETYAVANAEVSLGASVPAVRSLALPVVKRVWVRPASEALVESTDVKTKTTNEPLDTKGSETTGRTDDLLNHLKALSEQTGDFEGEWRLRLAQLAMNREDEAAQVSPDLPEESRRLLASVVEVVTSVRKAARDPFPMAQEALCRVEALNEVLADWAVPVITTVALCRKVVTFGVYEEMDPETFVAGRTVRTIAYTEVRSLRSEPTEDGQYRTRLATRLEVLTAGGQTVWQHEEPDIVDLCRRRRTDFFIAQRVALPSTLPAGEYVLKVLVEDKLSGRASEASRPFSVQSAETTVATGD